MSRYLLTVSAWNDLDEISEYLIAVAGEQIAARIEDELFETFKKIADFPSLGHTRSDLTSRPVSFLTVDPYLIIYGRDTSSVVILAILHGARDVKRILRQRPFDRSD